MIYLRKIVQDPAQHRHVMQPYSKGSERLNSKILRENIKRQHSTQGVGLSNKNTSANFTARLRQGLQ